MQIPGLNLINGSAIQYVIAEIVPPPSKTEVQLSSSNHVEDTSAGSLSSSNDQQNGDPLEMTDRKIVSISEPPIAEALDLALEALSDSSSVESEGDEEQDSDDAERYHSFVRFADSVHARTVRTRVFRK